MYLQMYGMLVVGYLGLWLTIGGNTPAMVTTVSQKIHVSYTYESGSSSEEAGPGKEG